MPRKPSVSASHLGNRCRTRTDVLGPAKSGSPQHDEGHGGSPHFGTHIGTHWPLWVSKAREEFCSDLKASGSADASVRVWDANRGECLGTLEGHKGEVLRGFGGTVRRLGRNSIHGKLHGLLKSVIQCFLSLM